MSLLDANGLQMQYDLHDMLGIMSLIYIYIHIHIYVYICPIMSDLFLIFLNTSEPLRSLSHRCCVDHAEVTQR